MTMVSLGAKTPQSKCNRG